MGQSRYDRIVLQYAACTRTAVGLLVDVHTLYITPAPGASYNKSVRASLSLWYKGSGPRGQIFTLFFEN